MVSAQVNMQLLATLQQLAILVFSVSSRCVRSKSGHAHVLRRICSPSTLPGCDQQEIAIGQGRSVGKRCSGSIHVGGGQKHNRTTASPLATRHEMPHSITCVVFVPQNL